MNKKTTLATRGWYLMVFLIFTALPALSQNDLKSLLDIAEKNYPGIAAKHAEAEAGEERITLEKNTFLPDIDIAYQANYATFNNITGMSYPGSLMPISGPPSPENYNDMVPGSGGSINFTWIPVTFGQRSAAVDYYKNRYEGQLAGLDDELLKVKFKVAFFYLEIANTHELLKAYKKNIERNEFNLRQVSALVAAGIRPTVDSLKFQGELSKAKTYLYELENQLENQKAELSEMLAVDNLQDIQINPSIFERNPSLIPTGDIIKNPSFQMATFEVAAQEARFQQEKRAWLPKLELWSTAYGRGSGVNYDNGSDVSPTITPSEGWSFSRYNYGVGFQVVFPILGLRDVQLRTRQQQATLNASRNYLDQTKLKLKKDYKISVSDLSSSLMVIGEVPVEYRASEATYHALQTRYQAGILDYFELIQAQYDLLNAEARMKTAYINSWKSLLRLSLATGDMDIFLQQILD
jgi:outer membrane protein TolC